MNSFEPLFPQGRLAKPVLACLILAWAIGTIDEFHHALREAG